MLYLEPAVQTVFRHTDHSLWKKDLDRELDFDRELDLELKLAFGEDVLLFWNLGVGIVPKRASIFCWDNFFL